MADVFISYSRKDHVWSGNLTQILERDGISCWTAPRNLTNAYNYEEQIPNAISECKMFIFLVSKNSIESKVCQGEVAFAFDLKKIILPIHLEQVELPVILSYYLTSSQSIHLYHDYEKGLDWVKTAVEDYLGRAESKDRRPEIVQENKDHVVEESISQQKDTKKVFISHDCDDAGRVAKYVKLLESNGVPCWIAPRDIPYGSNYAREIPVAIKNCGCFVVFVSKKSQLSEEIDKEIEIANKFSKTIIPAKLDNCEFSGPYMYHLTNKQWFEAYKNQKEDIDKLINNLKAMGMQNAAINSIADKSKISDRKLPDLLLRFMEFLLECFEVIWNYLVSAVGIITIGITLYLLIFRKEISIQITDMIEAIHGFIG